MAHWTEKRTMRAALGRALKARGWKLYGWHDDNSDGMTDYYDPEDWVGVATRDGVIVVVDQHDARSSGYVPERSERTVTGPCAHCDGKGTEPALREWTLERARADWRGYREAEQKVRRERGDHAVALFGDVISPIPFDKHGTPTCHRCHGSGEAARFDRVKGEAWPTFHPNPPRRVWHVERDGRILGSGVGLWAIYDANRHHPEKRQRFDARLGALVDRIEAAAAKGAPKAPRGGNGASKPAPVDRVTVSEGRREGIVEVRFPEKPDDETRAELKRCGFRWTRRSACWYGPRVALPASIAEGEG